MPPFSTDIFNLFKRKISADKVVEFHTIYLQLLLSKAYHLLWMYNRKCNEMSDSCHERLNLKLI
ncbi:hypothetical protein DUD46_15115 [Listeria monocytogenes]|nr:hypothetical protein [Listeria monocytogenes]